MAQENSLVKTLEKNEHIILEVPWSVTSIAGDLWEGGADSWHQHCQVRSTFPHVRNCWPFSVNTGTKSHDLTMLWYEHPADFSFSPREALPRKHVLSFPEFPFEFHVTVCLSVRHFQSTAWSHNPQVPTVTNREYSALLIWSTKLYWTRVTWSVEDSVRHPSSIVPPLISIPVKHLFFLFLWNIWLIVTLVQETTSHLYLFLCLSHPFLILGALVTRISKYLRKLCSRV